MEMYWNYNVVKAFYLKAKFIILRTVLRFIHLRTMYAIILKAF